MCIFLIRTFAAARYEARQFGIYSATPSRTAYQKYPELTFVQPRFEAYCAVPEQIQESFYRYTDLVKPLALDEVYLDVTANKPDIPSALSLLTQASAELVSRDKARA